MPLLRSRLLRSRRSTTFTFPMGAARHQQRSASASPTSSPGWMPSLSFSSSSCRMQHSTCGIALHDQYFLPSHLRSSPLEVTSIHRGEADTHAHIDSAHTCTPTPSHAHLAPSHFTRALRAHLSCTKTKTLRHVSLYQSFACERALPDFAQPSHHRAHHHVLILILTIFCTMALIL